MDILINGINEPGFKLMTFDFILDSDSMLAKLKSNLDQSFPMFSLRNIQQLFGLSAKQESIMSPVRAQLGQGIEPLTTSSEVAFESAFASFSKVASTSPSPLRFDPDLKVAFSWREPPVGKFILVGRTSGDRATVRSITAGHANEVNRAIFSKVLEGANIVDYTAVSHGGVDAYFFTKENVWESSDDIKALYRLGPLVNLTTHDTQTDAGMTMDVKVHLDGAVVNLRYGTDAEGEKGRILRHAYKTLVRRAWTREKDPALSTRNWDSNQRQQLAHKGVVDGYEVVYKRDPDAYPELANDLDNVQIVAKQQSQRRRMLEN